MEEKEFYEYQANVRLSLAFILTDICESLLLDIKEYRDKAKLPGLRYEQKMFWKAFLRDSRNLRRALDSDNTENATEYANVCEMLEVLILTAIDRCSDDSNENMVEFIEHIRTYPSIRNMEIKD